MTIPFLNLFKKAKIRFSPRTVAAAPVSTASRRVVVEKRPEERLSKTVMPNATKTLVAPDPFRTASGAQTGGRDLPPAIALALEPKVERAISLQLSDILEHVPGGYVKSAASFDANRNILLSALEIEKGMANGQPTISLASVYKQAPEIFLRSIPADDATQVPLPYDKVLQQFQSL